MSTPIRLPRCGAAAALASVLWAVGPAGLDAGGAQGRPGQGPRQSPRELAAGKLLVAARNLPDPNFSRTVVLLAEFNEDGAMGLIVNRPTTITLAKLLPDLGQPRARETTAFFGGPVSAQGVLALLRSRSTRRESRLIVRDVYLVHTRDVFEEMIGAGADATRFRVYVGYAGWGAGQLERETLEGAWHVLDGDADAVFDPDPGSMWQRQIRRTRELSARRGTGGVPVGGPAVDWLAAGAPATVRPTS